MKRGTSDGTYEIGKGRPPKAYRWKQGQSGNPAGRKAKPDTIAEILKTKLKARVNVGEARGRPRTMSMQELIIEQLIRDSAKGDPRARTLLFTLIARYDGTDEAVINPQHLSREDQDLIEAFVANAAGAVSSGIVETPAAEQTERGGDGDEQQPVGVTPERNIQGDLA